MAMAQSQQAVAQQKEETKDSGKIKQAKRKDIIIAYLFMLPALLGILGFIFIPIIFAFIMSLYINPTPTDLSNRFVQFFTNFKEHLNRIYLYNFFTHPEDSIFVDRGIKIFIWGILFVVYIIFFYKKLRPVTQDKISSVSLAFLSIISGLVAAPLILQLFQWLMYLLPFRLPINNYYIVLTDVQLDFLRILFNTVFWTVVCTFSHIVLGIFLAVLLNKDFQGKGFFRGIFILPWAIPSFASTVIWKNFIFDKYGFLGLRTNKIFPEGSFIFSLGNLLAILLGVVMFILVFFVLRKLSKKAFTINQDYKALLSMALLIISFFPGYYFYQFLNPILGGESLSLLNYAIVDIPNTEIGTFWILGKVYIVGQNFRMITFSAIIINIWLGVPFMMVSFLAAMQAIPQDLYEAAEIDGANTWEQFKQITFPMIKPTLFTVSLLGFVWTFNLFNVVYILARNQNLPGNVDYSIYVTFIYDLFYPAGGTPQYTQAAALSFVVFLMLTTFSRAYKKIFNVDKLFEGNEQEVEQYKLKEIRKIKSTLIEEDQSPSTEGEGGDK